MKLIKLEPVNKEDTLTKKYIRAALGIKEETKSINKKNTKKAKK